MINEITFKRIKQELERMQQNKDTDNDRPDLVDRLELAMLILDSNTMSLQSLSDYKRYCEKEGIGKPIISLFARYLYPNSNGGNNVGIINYISKMLDVIKMNASDDSSIRRTEKVEKELGNIQKELQDVINREQELFEKIDDLEKERALVEDKNQRYKDDMERYNSLSESVKELKEKIDEYERNVQVLPQEKLQERSEELNKQYEKIKTSLKDHGDILLYYKRVKEIVDAYNIAKEVNSIRSIILAYEDDREALRNIERRSLVPNTNAMKVIRDKIDPLYNDFSKKLGEIISELTTE